MKIIAIANQKGGTGKTTTVINLGVTLHSLGKKVFLIDLDPQANLTYSFGIHSPSFTIADALQGKKSLQDIQIEKEGVVVVPSSIALANVEISLVNKIGRESVLKERLKNIKGYDYIFIDCPPSLSILTVNALNAAHEVLIPVQMEILSLQGLSQLLDTIKEVKQVLNNDLKVRGIVPSLYDCRRRLSDEVLLEIGNNTKEKVFTTRVRECVKIAEAPSFAKSVLAYAPFSNGAVDFRNLAKEIIKERG